MKNPSFVLPTIVSPATATQSAPMRSLYPNMTSGVEPTQFQPISAQHFCAYLNVTVVPGIDTVLLQLEEYNPATGVWTDVPGGATLAQIATGLIRLLCGVDVTEVAASTTLRVLNQPVPAIWRIKIVHSGAGSFTYTLSIAVGQP